MDLTSTSGCSKGGGGETKSRYRLSRGDSDWVLYPSPSDPGSDPALPEGSWLTETYWRRCQGKRLDNSCN